MWQYMLYVCKLVSYATQEFPVVNKNTNLITFATSKIKKEPQKLHFKSPINITIYYFLNQAIFFLGKRYDYFKR